jgi:hypothetical protein
MDDLRGGLGGEILKFLGMGEETQRVNATARIGSELDGRGDMVRGLIRGSRM